jgi:glycosyltransferase involved in cell wall biosynthesis
MLAEGEFVVRFTQIAETDGSRVMLSKVDLDHHRYPYEVLFAGALSAVSLPRRLGTIVGRTIRSDADLFVLCGYERLDCWLQLLVLKLRRRKVALFLDSTANDHPRRLMRDALKRIFLRSLDGVFGYGQRSKEYVVLLGASPQKVFIPCVAAALKSDFSAAAVLEARCRAGLSAHSPQFLFVGRLVLAKGVDLLIDAFAKIRNDFPLARLVIVGDGPQRQFLQAKAASLLPNCSVQFKGIETGVDLSAEFAHATALVLSSTSEPWGLVVNEALAHGCPVIVSDCCGCGPELVINGETGYLHRTGDIEDLADKLRRAPSQFADRAASGYRCQEVVARYTPENAALNILRGCREIFAKASTHAASSGASAFQHRERQVTGVKRVQG